MSAGHDGPRHAVRSRAEGRGPGVERKRIETAIARKADPMGVKRKGEPVKVGRCSECGEKPKRCACWTCPRCLERQARAASGLCRNLTCPSLNT